MACTSRFNGCTHDTYTHVVTNVSFQFTQNFFHFITLGYWQLHYCPHQSGCPHWCQHTSTCMMYVYTLSLSGQEQEGARTNLHPNSVLQMNKCIESLWKSPCLVLTSHARPASLHWTYNRQRLTLYRTTCIVYKWNRLEERKGEREKESERGRERERERFTHIHTHSHSHSQVQLTVHECKRQLGRHHDSS